MIMRSKKQQEHSKEWGTEFWQRRTGDGPLTDFESADLSQPDGWPAATRQGCRAAAHHRLFIEPGRTYTEEEEKALHVRQQQAADEAREGSPEVP